MQFVNAIYYSNIHYSGLVKLFKSWVSNLLLITQGTHFKECQAPKMVPIVIDL